jgi:hypothetical protein
VCVVRMLCCVRGVCVLCCVQGALCNCVEARSTSRKVGADEKGGGGEREKERLKEGQKEG